jgi:hypothetical protein
MSLSPNMTDKHLDAVMSALPDELSEAELCALTLTVYSAFIDSPAKIMSGLISAVFTLGADSGVSNENICLCLRMAADLHEKNPNTKH